MLKCSNAQMLQFANNVLDIPQQLNKMPVFATAIGSEAQVGVRNFDDKISVWLWHVVHNVVLGLPTVEC